MIRITRKVEFSASHFYHNPNFSAEENRRVFGKCNNPHGHGHNYTLEVTIAGEPDPATGMVLDLKELKDILQREVMDRMDHRHLNYEVPELAGQDSHLREHRSRDLAVARAEDHAWQTRSRARLRISQSFRRLHRRLRVHERRREARMKISLTRRYDFAASHRLHAPQLSDAENQRHLRQMQ